MPSSDQKIQVCLLWHMHQPYYKDLVTGVYRLPWTRMHGLKDYYGMVRLLEEFPTVHVTFNLVPSLLIQLEDYAAGTADDPIARVAYTPADELRMEDRVLALNTLFQANTDRLISRYPRYLELYERFAASEFQAARALPLFQTQDLSDLQVLSQLAWFDEFFQDHDEVVRELALKGRGFTLEDQRLLYGRQQALLTQIIPAYRRASDRGQVELSTSPFYHPILPLLCDTDAARDAHHGVPLPRTRFIRPEDARLQLERAIKLHTDLFGGRPAGVWPSEGSVSPQVAELCASLNVKWMATDQRILGNSLGTAFFRDGAGEMVNAEQLYAPYRYETPSGPVNFLFRDQELADLIGFVYSRMDAQAAAEDMVNRIIRSAGAIASRGQKPVVPIILDGENAWEYYPFSGREFLRALYSRLAAHPQIECLTFSEVFAASEAIRPLPRLATGSWIGANFDIWIGAWEDNLAWDMLAAARDFYDREAYNVTEKARSLAMEELLIAEGSDWCWWYGPEHSTANDPDFDALFRAHLANVYRTLGGRPPDELTQPIAHFGRAFQHEAPAALIHPKIDGRITNYFEWMGAGTFVPDLRASTMHGKSPVMRQVQFGHDNNKFFIRVDFSEGANSPPMRQRLQGHTFHVMTRQAGKASALQVQLTSGDADDPASPWVCHPFTSVDVAHRSAGVAACKQILEVEVSFEDLGLATGSDFEFQLSLWQDNLPLETIPRDGWISIPANPQPPV